MSEWGATGSQEAEEEPPPLVYASLDRFIEDYFVKVYARNLDTNGIRWCPEWWRHAEAVGRLEAVWRAWELLRTDPGEGASNWWLGHADRHMHILLSDTGPFSRCIKGQHASGRVQPLPFTPVPAGWTRI